MMFGVIFYFILIFGITFFVFNVGYWIARILVNRKSPLTQNEITFSFISLVFLELSWIVGYYVDKIFQIAMFRVFGWNNMMFEVILFSVLMGFIFPLFYKKQMELKKKVIFTIIFPFCFSMIIPNLFGL